MAGTSGTALLVGDSHAEMLAPLWEEYAREHHMRLLVAVADSCPWPRDLITGVPERVQRCRKTKALVDEHLLLDADLIIAAGFPRTTVQGARPKSNRSDLADLPRNELVERLAVETVEAWVAVGRSVVLVEPIPLLEHDQLNCLSGATTLGACAEVGVQSPIEAGIYRRLASQHPNVMSLDLERLVCPRLPICDPIVEGAVVRRDSNHLTTAFVNSITRQVIDEVDAMLPT